MPGVVSWAEVAKVVDPEEDDWKRLRSAIQREYDAAVCRTGLGDPIDFSD